MAKVNVEKDFIYNKIMDIREYNPSYHADGTLVWKKIGGKTGRKGKRKQKTYPSISMEKITLSGNYKVDEEILEESRKRYAETGQMIPVYLSYDLRLLYGYEQYVLAKELSLNSIPFQRKNKMNKKEQRQFVKTPTDRPFGNKKISIKTVDGKTQWISQCQYKKVRRCRQHLKQQLGDFKLVHVGNMKFAIADKNGQIFDGFTKGKSINGIHAFIGSHKFENGAFIKKSQSKKANGELLNTEKVKEEQ